MNISIVKCTNNTYDLVIVSVNTSKGVRKNYTSLDEITDYEKQCLIAEFIHLEENEVLTIPTESYLSALINECSSYINQLKRYHPDIQLIQCESLIDWELQRHNLELHLQFMQLYH